MRARIGLALVLALSLGAKAASTRTAPNIDGEAFSAHAEGLLKASGFEVSRERHRFGTMVRGRAGACTIMVGDYPPHGTLRQALGIATREVGPLRYAWRGTVSAEAPKLLPLADFYLWREAARLGLSLPRHPIVAFASSPRCDPGRIDWGRFDSA